MGNRDEQIRRILNKIKGIDENLLEQGIPLDWWIDRPDLVAKQLNVYNREMGIPKRFSPEECKRFKD